MMVSLTSINLTPVLSSIFHFDCFNIECPRIVVIVRHRESTIVCDDVLVNGKNGFSIRFNPSDLF